MYVHQEAGMINNFRRIINKLRLGDYFRRMLSMDYSQKIDN